MQLYINQIESMKSMKNFYDLSMDKQPQPPLQNWAFFHTVIYLYLLINHCKPGMRPPSPTPLVHTPS